MPDPASLFTLKQALEWGRQELAGSSDTIQADVEILLCHLLACDRSYLYTWPDKKLDEARLSRFRQCIALRRKGRPVAYITGRKAFWEFSLKVNDSTLIPRPETELLVEQSLARIPQDQPLQILDLGTGSGAIALAIAHERPLCTVTAIEKSGDAMEVARWNTQQLGIENISLLMGNWLSPVSNTRFDIIVSNPPYIAENDPHLETGDVRHEPVTTLASGKDGLDDIRIIIMQAKHHLVDGGWLLLEHGCDQACMIRKILVEQGYSDINTYPDLAGHDRVTAARISTRLR